MAEFIIKLNYFTPKSLIMPHILELLKKVKDIRSKYNNKPRGFNIFYLLICPI